MMSHTRTSVANAFVLCPKSQRSPSAENRDRMAMSGHTAVMIHEPKTTNTSTAATITMSKAQNLRKRRSMWRRFRSLFLLVVMILFILYYKLTSGRVDKLTSGQVNKLRIGYQAIFYSSSGTRLSMSSMRSSRALTTRRVAFMPSPPLPFGKSFCTNSFCRFSKLFTPKGIPLRFEICSLV